jgi:hypothetical protein
MSIGAFGLVFITFAAFGLADECCPSCESAEVAAANVNGDDAGCDQCEDCLSQTNHGSAELAIDDSAKEKDLLAMVAPWITPFGGLLLVCAHLMNRRCGYLCGCC